MDNDPSARVTRLATPVASPGTCGVCGTIEHPDGFADARLDFEFYGTFYLCGTCVGDYARLFGYKSESDVVALQDQLDAQNTELNTLRQAVLGLESTVDSLISDAHRRSSKRADDIATDHGRKPDKRMDDVQVDEPVAVLDNPEPAVTDQPVVGAEPVSDKPAKQQRPNDLFDTSDADALLGL